MKYTSTKLLTLAAGLVALATVTALPASVSAQISLSRDVIAQRTVTPREGSVEIEQGEAPSRGPTTFEVEPRPTDPEEREATQTCDGVLSCMDTLAFCDDEGGGMSKNPDGTWTCTYSE